MTCQPNKPETSTQKHPPIADIHTTDPKCTSDQNHFCDCELDDEDAEEEEAALPSFLFGAIDAFFFNVYIGVAASLQSPDSECQSQDQIGRIASAEGIPYHTSRPIGTQPRQRSLDSAYESPGT